MLDADSADFRVQQNAYINLQDFRFGPTSDKGFAEQLESVGGTVLIANTLPSGINYCIGVAEDGPNRRTVYFNWNDGGNHGIYCFDFAAAVVYVVLLNSQVTGGLNFDRLHLIHSARVENQNIYWTDNLNLPRRLNIDAGIKMNQPSYGTTVLPYTNPLSQSVIAWIRRQPGLPPLSPQKKINGAVSTNQIAGEAFEFAYRYVYRDFELSTLSGLSPLANYNYSTDTFNFMTVTLPLGEQIDQDVLVVDMVARYFTSGIYFIIKSWDKRNATDAAAIAAHNAGTTALSYDFYNNFTGIALDSAYSVKEFDSVPLLTQSIEVAKNRSFMGNNLVGYDTPQITSLALSLITYTPPVTPGTALGVWYFLQFNNSDRGDFSTYIIYIGNAPDPSQNGYYWLGFVTPPIAGTIAFTDLTFVGTSTTDVMSYFMPTGDNTITSYFAQGSSNTITGMGGGSGAISGNFMKSDAQYKACVTFYDNYGQKTPAVTNDSLVIPIPDRTYSSLNNISGIAWTLSNAGALAEIPAMAYYYSVDLTLCLRTRFFLQGQALSAPVGSAPGINITYATKDSTNVYKFDKKTYDSTVVGVAIDISSLSIFAQQGYVLAQGDIIKIYLQSTGTVYSLPLIGQSAQYIIAGPKDIGTLADHTASPVNTFFEIYTPFKPSTSEPFFEQGVIQKVSNPGTGTRMYSNTTGTFIGDVYAIYRDANLYITEAMSPNDLYYTKWNTNAGRSNIVSPFGQTRKLTNLAFSNTFISGSQNNGLSTFDALDSQDISVDFGPIQKLQLASKVSKIGTVMLAICSRPSTASIYLSENTLISQTGDSVVAQANTVIGSIHELKGEFGTLNPESVIEFRGNIYWYDAQNGKIIQYADNGLFPISNYKMSRFWNLFSNQYKSLSAADIEALGSRPFVFGCADPHHGELLFTVPKVLAAPPNGFLPDYPDKPYPFDIWDGIGKTVSYKLYTDPNHWQGSFSFTPDYMFYLENNLYSLKNGNLYLHNQDNYCQYYGTQYAPAVMCLSNQEPKKVKSYNNFSAQGSAAPIFTYFMSLYEFLQSSDLVTSDFKNLEGNFYASIYRNKLDPAFGDNFPAALIAGEKMRTQALYVMAQWDASAGIVQVQFLGVGFTLSLGQQVQRKQ